MTARELASTAVWFGIIGLIIVPLMALPLPLHWRFFIAGAIGGILSTIVAFSPGSPHRE